MLIGEKVTVRPVMETDLELIQREMQDLESRGPWYPLPQRSFVKLRKSYEEDGLWASDHGTFMIEVEGRTVGQINWGLLDADLPDMGIGYRVYATEDRGKGYGTEALVLLTRYLFDTEPINRAFMVIHVDNKASQRLAEKAGFRQASREREAWKHKGVWHDVYRYDVTRREFDERWPSSTGTRPEHSSG